MDDPDACEHDWVTYCNGVTHVDICMVCCATVNSGVCPDAGTWLADDDEK